MDLTPEQRELRRAHQRRLEAARLLVDLEDAAGAACMPALDWQITDVGLVGRPEPSASPAQRRAAWQAWAAYLELGAAADAPVELSGPGRTQVLRGETRLRIAPDAGRVRVVLHAEIDQEESTDAP